MDSGEVRGGAIGRVRGSVVDVRFDSDLPELGRELIVGESSLEVISHLDRHTARCLALKPTRGLARGDAVVDTGRTLTVPVGPETLGRMFNVFGETIDGGAPVTTSMRRPVVGPPVALIDLSTSDEIFETGIKAIDVLVPLERGGKTGLFGGAGVGKTVLI